MNFITRYRARQVIRQRVAYHMRVRATLLYLKKQQDMDDEWNHAKSHEESERLWHEAGAEFRCSDRLRKLLTKYK